MDGGKPQGFAPPRPRRVPHLGVHIMASQPVEGWFGFRAHAQGAMVRLVTHQVGPAPWIPFLLTMGPPTY